MNRDKKFPLINCVRCTLLRHVTLINMLPASCLARRVPLIRTRVGWCLHATARHKSNSVALVLSGSGVYDGSEVHESSAMLMHLSRLGVKVKIFAPDMEQAHVINHSTGQPSENEKRNVLVESCRIARGPVENIKDLKSSDFCAVLFPGGFGAAKNLSTFAFDGADCKVLPEIERIIKEFHAAKKPIGLCCVAPVLAVAVLRNITVTVGHDTNKDGKWPYYEVAQTVKDMGAKHVNTTSFGLCIDEKNHIVTTPAYMCNNDLYKIFDGIGNLINSIIRMTKNSH